MSQVRSRSFLWYGTLIWKGVTLSARWIVRTVRRLRRWLFSRDGLVFLSSFAIALIIGSLWILDSMHAGLSQTVSEESAGENGDQRVPNPVLARIGLELITLNQVLEFAWQEGKLPQGERVSATEALERGLVDDAVDQTLLARAAADEGLVADPDVRARLTAARNRILAAAFLEARVEELVTPEAAQELYQVQRRSMSLGEEIRLREIVTADAQTAIDLSASINSGVPFEQVARNNSIAPSAANGGDLGYMSADAMPAAYAENAGSLSRGLITLPFQTEAGWVILKVEGRQRITPPSYSQLEPELIEFLRLRTIDTTLSELREKSSVEIIDPGATGQASDPDPERQPAALRN